MERHIHNKIIFTQEQLEDIKNSYLNNESSVSIGKRYNVGHKVILKRLHEMGVVVDQRKFVRKYYVDESYFDSIDTPNKAYILGFLYADGCNCKSKGTISMSLEEHDKDILEKIRKELKSEKPLEYIDNSKKCSDGYNYKNQYRLLIFSTHMCEALEKIGMVPNKSLVLSFPDIREDLIPHFIRGYFDGDGSVCQQYVAGKHLPQYRLTITSTENFCKSISKIANDTLSLYVGVYDAACHNGVTRVCVVSGKWVVKKFLDWIYCDAELYLQRKYDRYVNYYTNKSLTA